MYERSAIVLERYFDNLFGLDKKDNLKLNYQNYKKTVEEIQNYQTIVMQEEDIIQRFDAVAKEIQMIQKRQEKLYESNKKLEDDRNKLFNNLEDESKTLEKNFKKIEDAIEKNNEELKELRQNFVNFLGEFSERQKERNKFAKERRIVESKYMSYMNEIKEELKQISVPDVKEVKAFYLSEDTKAIKEELFKLMIDNGKNERIGFDNEVIKDAIEERINIAKKEAECYIMAYERMRKLIDESDNDNIKLDKYRKNVRDLSVKINFLNVEKEYLVAFLDNERMTVINGQEIHKKLMKEACKNFLLDIDQIHNLYDLILKEISAKATKKAYKELYNYDYLQTIQDSEKNFENEVNQLNINAGAIINSNYWRINGISNIYTVFQVQLKEKFGKDVMPEEEKIEIKVGAVEERKSKKRGRKKKVVENSELNADQAKKEKNDKEFNLYKLDEFSKDENNKDHHKNLLDEDNENTNSNIEEDDDYEDLFIDFDDEDIDDDKLEDVDENDDTESYEEDDDQDDEYYDDEEDDDYDDDEEDEEEYEDQDYYDEDEDEDDEYDEDDDEDYYDDDEEEEDDDDDEEEDDDEYFDDEDEEDDDETGIYDIEVDDGDEEDEEYKDKEDNKVELKNKDKKSKGFFRKMFKEKKK